MVNFFHCEFLETNSEIFLVLASFFETGSHCNLAGFKFANDPEFQIFLSLPNRIKCFSELGMAVYSFDPSIWKAETGRSLRATWFTKVVIS